MSLLSFMTASADTTRPPAMSSDKIGDPVTNLESVKITPPQLPDFNREQRYRQMAGLDGTLVQIFECSTESHTHTDSSSSVTQMPDIIAGDRVVISSVTYNVLWAEQQPATGSFGATLLIIMSEDKRA